jgi:hypothetical protein
MNNQLYPCNECEGKGKYVIYNAYDKNYKNTIVCEFCNGAGYVERNIEVPIVKIELCRNK